MVVRGKLHVCLLLLYFDCMRSVGGEPLDESNRCRLETGEPGECKLLKECPPRIEEVRQGRRHSESARCGWDGFEEIVCCPTKLQEKIGIRPADLACQQYTNEITSVPTPSILGGIEASSNDMPYMVALGFIDKTKLPKRVIKYNCGGTIIAANYVLTAAHCVYTLENDVPVLMRVGAESLEPSAEGAQYVRVDRIITHPRYRRSEVYNDIAIIKSTNPFRWTKTVQPICLLSKPISDVEINANVSIVVAGWGATDFGEDTSNILLKTPDLNLVPYSQCAKSYEKFPKVTRGFDDSILCAIDSNQTRRADTCQGDSGGPLLMLDTQGDTLIGVTSFGQTCGSSTPGAYTSVFSFLDWIEEKVWPDHNTQSRFGYTD